MSTQLVPSRPAGALDAVRCALAVLCVLYFSTGFALYGTGALGLPSPTLVAGIAALLALGCKLVGAPGPGRFLRSPVLVWMIAFGLVVLAWAALLGAADPQALRERLKALFLLAALALVLDEPRARTAGLAALAAAVVLMAVANLTELFGLVGFVDFRGERIPWRASGFFLNSNEAGRAAVFACALAVPAVARGWRIPILAAGGVAVLATFSRGSMLGFALLVAWLLWRRSLGRLRWLAPALGGVAIALWVALGHAPAFLGGAGLWNDDVRTRLRVLEWISDDSGREQLAATALAAFQQRPLAGHPLGTSDLLQPHNMYLALAVDHGVLGLLLFPSLGAALVAGARRVTPFPALLLVAGLFGHILLLEHATLVALALCATAPPAARAPSPWPRPSPVEAA